MTKFLCFLTILFSFNMLYANTLKVAVIDTGLNLKYSKYAHLCSSGHKDFTGEGFNDTIGHGTNVTGLIVNTAKIEDYCIILLKAYSVKRAYITEALEYAYSINVNVINISGGGFNPLEQERNIVEKILNSGITLVVAAGNNALDLDTNCNYYPACYDSRIYVIGNYSNSSNYGTVVDSYYDGENKTAFGVTLSGTSMSTAIFTGYLLQTIALLKK